MNDEALVYFIEGRAIDHEWIIANKTQIEAYMYDEIRAAGLIPILDVQPSYEYSFNAVEQIFDYRVEILAFRAGEKAQDWLGILVNDGVAISKDYKYVALYESLL